MGITDVTDQLADRGWRVDGRQLLVADRYGAAADMMVKWVVSDSENCNFDVAE